MANSNPIFDPSTTRNVGGVWMRDAFPGNIIPASRFDPVARNVLAIDPWVAPTRGGANAAGPNGNLLANEFARVFFNDFNLRLDHQVNSNFKFYFSWTQNDQSGYGRPINIKETNPEFDASQGNWNPFNGKNGSIGKTWIVSPSLVNDARVGYYRRLNQTVVPSFNENYAQKLGIPNVGAALMPGFGDTNRYSASSIYGIYGATPSRAVTETISFRDDLSYIRGTHAFKFGYEQLRFRLNNAIAANPVNFSFANVTAGLQPTGSRCQTRATPLPGS